MLTESFISDLIITNQCTPVYGLPLIRRRGYYLPMVRDIDGQKDQKNEEDERMIGEIDKAEGKVMKWWF